MNDNKLISALVSDLSAVKAKKPIRTTVLSFASSAIGTLIVFGSFFTFRDDLQEVIKNPLFLFSTFASLIVCLIGFFAVTFLSTPGRSTKPFGILLGVIAFGLILGLLIWPSSDPQAGMASAQGCTFGVIGLGLVSLLVFGFIAKKMAPMNAGLVGALCGVGASFVGMTALAFHCPSENPYHLLIWHLSLPVIGFSLIGYLLGRRFLRW